MILWNRLIARDAMGTKNLWVMQCEAICKHGFWHRITMRETTLISIFWRGKTWEARSYYDLLCWLRWPIAMLAPANY